ncbi:MAG: hypothetical protein [Microviridae sp.]|nr:MAG: hypothetical protein [Microviridae sp.]
MKEQPHSKLKSSMKKLRGTLNYKPGTRPGDMEIPRGISETVPDDSYTVAELLTKHQQGLALGIQRLGVYDELDEDDYDAMDMTEYQNLEKVEREQIAMEQAKTIKNEHHKNESKKQAAARKLEEEKALKQAEIERKAAEFEKLEKKS